MTAFAACALLSAADAQALLHSFGGAPGGRYGLVDRAGDVDFDGHADVILGAPSDDTNGTDAGSASVYSGLDGSVLHTFFGEVPGDFFGLAAAGAGDLNGDNHTDLIVGSPNASNNGAYSGHVSVFSGVDGSVMYAYDGDNPTALFGFSVSGAGDVDADGYDDFIVGAPLDDNHATAAGLARVLSGLDGSVLHSFMGNSAHDHLGWSVSGAGDINEDGHDDVIVGAHQDGLGGSAFVYSGSDGSTLYTFVGDSLGDLLGESVSGAGDVNGDTIPDVIVGAYGNGSGYARVFSGADGTMLYQFGGDSNNDAFGGVVSGAGVVDGDGHHDVLVGAWGDDDNGAGCGSARLLSGQDGSILHTFYGSASGDGMGASLSGAGDVNGDGLDDVLLVSFLDSNTGAATGEAQVYGFAGDLAGSPFCSGDGTGTPCPCTNGSPGEGCANSAGSGAVLAANGSAVFASDSFSLSISGIPGAKAGLCVKGSTRLAGGNGNAVGDGLLCTAPEMRSQVIVSGIDGQLTMNGWRGLPFGTFPNAANVGAPSYYQWWYRDPQNTCSGQGFNFSNAWAVTWQ